MLSRVSPGLEPLRRERHRSGLHVILKTPASDPPKPLELTSLRIERDILLALQGPGVPRPIALEFEPRPALLIEDPGGARIDELLAEGPPAIALTLAIGIQIAAVLGEMHRREMIHHGVRSDAILCDAAQARAWLVDFADTTGGIARSRAAPVLTRSIERLIYASPEQTGRMNRGIDERTDLYSLGVVLYELLTGAPPFRSNDALELIHAHIARVPPSPATLDARVPEPLAAVVLKLLAKNAEDRYASAAGVRADLEHCARCWAERSRIEPFALGAHDPASRFTIPQKLYGRDEEVAVLARAFDRASDPGAPRATLVLVAGYAGIGKTALIQELYKPIVRRRGFFLAGKFDQFARTTPFGALIQAFRALVRQLLTEPEARLAAWRAALTRSLGTNTAVLAEVIPEIEIMIGPQPRPAALAPTEALNRFRLVIQRFIATVARPGSPLVLFLDDLQWADPATLALFDSLLASPEGRNLMVLGAYRDNEVDALHPLVRTVAALEAGGARIERVELGPLRLPELTRLVADTLGSDERYAAPLARLVLEKTGGNPFFVIQFLKMLRAEDYIVYDPTSAHGHWRYRTEAIAAAPLTDNVIELMGRRLERLEPRTRHVLALAACIGNRFDDSLLATVSEQSHRASADDLAPALAEGLIQRVGHEVGAAEAMEEIATYAFLHDRVQQAAYALTPESRKDALHLSIGRLIRASTPPEAIGERMFDIVYHLNLGRAAIADERERVALANLDLAAGRKAKASTAFEAALDYFRIGAELLPGWQPAALAFELHLEAAECEYLCGHYDAAERRFEVLARHATGSIDRARVYRLASLQFEHRARYAEALARARDGLAALGFALPETGAATDAALEREIATIARLIGTRSIASLAESPRMQDVATCMAMSIMTDIWASVYILGFADLARLVSATMVRLSLEHGNIEESAYGYVTHAITVAMRGDYESAYEFGRLALAINEHFADTRRRAKIQQQFHAHVNFWRRPWHTCIEHARRAGESGLESGDFLYAAYGFATELWPAIPATQDLTEFVATYAPREALVRKLGNAGFADSTALIVNWARALQGSTRAAVSLSEGALDEDDYVRRYRDNPFFTAIHAILKLHLCYTLGEHAAARAAARTARGVVQQMPSTIWPILFEFWNALVDAAAHAEASADEQASIVAGLRRTEESFATLARNCPENFECPALIVAAEIRRIEGRHVEAASRYELAIASALKHQRVQELALANELCARFHRALGAARVATPFLAQARAAYASWGAGAKVAALAREFDATDGERVTVRIAASVTAPADARAQAAELDLTSILKAARAIFGETDVDVLLERLMRIVIENAGAERGHLILEDDHAPANIPARIVNYVRRTRESVVLAEASVDERFGDDPYVVQAHPRSVMCAPVIKQARLVGVIYLEHRMLDNVFTPDRIEVVQLLAAEAAISLENAQLIEGMRRALAEVDALRRELEAENTYLRRDLIVNVSHDLRTPLTAMRGYLDTLLVKETSLTPGERREYLGIATRQCDRLVTLVDELFELAKLEFRESSLALEPLALAEFAADVVQKFQLIAAERGVALGVEAVGDITLVAADAGLLERLFDNLIGNALRHTPRDGRVTIEIGGDAERVRVCVTDTGPGIAPEDQPRVFDRFYRGDRTPADQGAGLGLAIAKRIVELHGGSITVESVVPHGACFRVEFPVRAT